MRNTCNSKTRIKMNIIKIINYFIENYEVYITSTNNAIRDNLSRDFKEFSTHKNKKFAFYDILECNMREIPRLIF